MKNEFQSQTFKKFIYIQEKAICKCICIDLCKVGKIHVLHWQVSLYKFIRLAGDLLPPPLYVPYIDMLIGLSSNPQSAHYCFDLLKVNGMGSGRLFDNGSIMAHESLWKDIVYSASCVNEMTCHDSALGTYIRRKKNIVFVQNYCKLPYMQVWFYIMLNILY